MTRRMSGSSGSEGCLNIYFHLHKLGGKKHVLGKRSRMLVPLERREPQRVREQAAPRALGGSGPCSRVNGQCSGTNNPLSQQERSLGLQPTP